MSRLAAWLWRACSELGLRADIGFELTLPSARQLATIARVPNLGGANGMLVVATFAEIRDFTQELHNAGYGYSVLDEPAPGEEFDLESFKQMFRDWGWSGALGAKPAWMR